MKNNPQVKTHDLVIQEFEAETLIYDLKINRAFCLNKTSAMVWQLCDGKKSTAEISSLLSRKLKTPVSEDFVWLTLDLLHQNDLLEKSGDLRIEFGGLSRRKMIRKVGLATAAALPIIIGLSAPRAANAASDLCAGMNCNDFNACTIDGCDSATGMCFNKVISCDDGNPCTIDTCDPVVGCVNTPKGCPPGQTCNPRSGICG